MLYYTTHPFMYIWIKIKAVFCYRFPLPETYFVCLFHMKMSIVNIFHNQFLIHPMHTEEKTHKNANLCLTHSQTYKHLFEIWIDAFENHILWSINYCIYLLLSIFFVCLFLFLLYSYISFLIELTLSKSIQQHMKTNSSKLIATINILKNWQIICILC